MKTKPKRMQIAAALIIIFLGVGIALAAFNPLIDVNVVFSRCVNADEIATALQDTSFQAYQYYSVYDSFASLTVAQSGDTALHGVPLEGAALSAALSAAPRSTGIIVIDGSCSLLDVAKIKQSPFVDTVVVYFPILDSGDRDVLPSTSSRFFEKHPEARYWE